MREACWIDPGPSQGEAALPHDAAAIRQALLQLLARIDSVLEDERQLLGNVGLAELDRLIERKNHLALELTRLCRHARGVAADAAMGERLRQVSERLAENADLLRRHIDSVGQIATLIGQIVTSATSDGTYSRSVTSQGHAR